jgi:hypothetical protein
VSANLHNCGRPVARALVWLCAALASGALLAVPGGAAAQSSGLPTFSYPNDYAGATQPYPRTYLCPNALKNYPLSRFPLYGSPPAGYNYTSFMGPSTNIGFVYSYDFPYAATATVSLTPLTGPQKLADVASISDSSLQMDPGSANPLTPGTRVLTPNRHLHLLIIPAQPGAENPAFDVATLAPSLAAIPNRLVMPQSQQFSFNPIMRIYYPVNGYDNWGAGGPTHTNYPAIFQVDLTTGQIQSCDQQVSAIQRLIGGIWPENAVTSPVACVGCPPSRFYPRFSHQNPRYFRTGFGATTLTSPPFGVEPSATRSTARARAASFGAVAAQTEPEPDVELPVPGSGLSKGQPMKAPGPTKDGLVYFYRPAGAIPGMNVAADSDQCATNALATLDPREAAIIRVPIMPTTYNTRSVTATTVFAQPQARLWTLGVYGRKLEYYTLGYPNNFYLGNMDIRLDRTHGATFLIYPWGAGRAARLRYARIAAKNGWNVLRGELPSAGSGDEVIIRARTFRDGYYGALYPRGTNGAGAPCYADDPAFGPSFPFKNVPAQFRITPASMGPAAMMGVVCDASAAKRQAGVRKCVSKLDNAFKKEKGSYIAKPPA